METSGKYYSTSSTNVKNSKRVALKLYGHRKRVPIGSGMAVETRTETAIDSIRALSETDQANRYGDLAALESTDMWFGDPKDMSKEDIDFFGLEN